MNLLLVNIYKKQAHKKLSSNSLVQETFETTKIYFSVDVDKKLLSLLFLEFQYFSYYIFKSAQNKKLLKKSSFKAEKFKI